MEEKKITNAAVLGGGIMGPGIAQVLAMAGCWVVVYDISKDALTQAAAALRKSLHTFVEQGELALEEEEEMFHQVTFTGVLPEAVKDAQILFEAVSENPKVKKSVYEELDEILEEDVILASNTSFLNIFELMPKRRLPHTIIAHWYAPPQLIPLVEVVPGEETLPGICETAMALLRRGGKQPVKMNKFIQGYIINRLQMCLNQEIFYLLDNGYCTASDIDLAVKSSLIPRAMVLGVCQRMDFASLNMAANNFRNKVYSLPPAVDMPKTLQEHLDRGETGVKDGKGFYDYTGMDTNELLAKRDRQLFQAFRLEKEFMADPIGKAVLQ